MQCLENLITERLNCSLICKEDAEDIFKMISESKSDLAKFLDWAKNKITLQDCIDWTVSVNKNASLGANDFLYILRDKVTLLPIGCAGYDILDYEKLSFSLGFWIRSLMLNKGFATEITKALVQQAFLRFNAEEIYITCAKDNIATIRVASKAGLKEEPNSINFQSGKIRLVLRKITT